MASPAQPMAAGRGQPQAERWLAGPLAVRFGVLAVTAAASALGAWLGAWWVPFVAGLAAGVLGRAGARGRAGAGDTRSPVTRRTRQPRGVVLPAAVGAALGWAIPIWALALDGQPVGATARVIAGLAGLPPYAGVAVAVTLLLAALQVLAGAWLASALLPARAVTRENPETKRTKDPGNPQT